MEEQTNHSPFPPDPRDVKFEVAPATRQSPALSGTITPFRAPSEGRPDAVTDPESSCRTPARVPAP